MEDTACTSCHSNLEKHRSVTAGSLSPAVKNPVTHFDDSHHPEFRALDAKDPGQLRFNHALHLAQGFTLENGGKAFTFAQIAATERARYGLAPAQGLDTPVPALDCATCHRLDGDPSSQSMSRFDSSRSITPARSSGAYMLPVTYENDCRACHPLEFDPKGPGRQVRHGLSPGEVFEELRQFYRAQAALADPKLLGRFIAPRAKPGSPADAALEQVGRAVDDKLLIAVKILFGSGVTIEATGRQHVPVGRGGCALCHHLSPAPGPLVRPDVITKVAIEPVKVPIVWFERAVFDHSAHRAVDCNACHSAAKTSERNTDVLLPGITKCIQCHGPAAGRGGETRGGAGHSCTECHRYHNGDHSLQGIGASARGVDERRTIDRFLQGTQKK